MKSQITEKDIFNCVFYPELISKEKKKYLENSSDFHEEIKFYSSLKESLNKEIGFEIRKKICINSLKMSVVSTI